MKLNIFKPCERSPEADIFDISPGTANIVLHLFLYASSLYFLAWIFYENTLISLISTPLSLLLLKQYKKYYIKKVRAEIEEEFTDLNRLIIAEMEAKIPIEKALRNIEERLYTDEIYEFKHMKYELRNWIRHLELGLKLEEILTDFAERSGETSYRDYAKMVNLSGKMGSKIFEVIVNTNQVLQERREMKNELDVLLTEKKLEQKIMSFMPVALILMLKNMSYEFIAPLYESIQGRIVMTVVLIIFGISYFWSSKLAELK